MKFEHRLTTIVLAGLVCSCGLNASAATRSVPSAYPTIQAAVNAAVAGDVIEVDPGVYIEAVSFLGKGIVVRSTQGAAVTIIQSPSPTWDVITMMRGEPPSAVLEGFTLRGGNFGIQMATILPTIRSNIITANRVGIVLRSASPVIQGNTIVSNGPSGGIFIHGSTAAQILGNNISHNTDTSAAGGGAIEMIDAGKPVVRNNLISYNSAPAGGAISITSFSAPLIEQNLVIRNESGGNGTIFWLAPFGAERVHVINNTIAFNNSPIAAGIAADGFDSTFQIINNIIYASGNQTGIRVGSTDSALPLIRTNLVYSETGAHYAGIAPDLSGINGNIGADPAFMNAGNNNFQLRTGSPAIDTALASRAPAVDFGGFARPVDGNGDGVAEPDLGAYEFLGGNHPPAADAMTLAVMEDDTVAFQLTGSDPDGDDLTFRVISDPAHGTLDLRGQHVVYSPAANYFGADSFTYIANDSRDDSEPATVTIEVTPVNDAPTAAGAAFNTAEDNAIPVLLVAHDVDHDPLAFLLSETPQHGTLSGNAPNLVYTPAANFAGRDSLEFFVRDSSNAESARATVWITVAAVNDVPIAIAQSVTTAEGAAVTIELTGADADGDRLTARIVTLPAHGSLSLSENGVEYSPAPNFHGADSFEFVMSDGQAESSPARVDITVTSVNNAPVANDAAFSGSEDTAVPITLSGSDADGDAVAFILLAAPEHGTLSGDAPNLTYKPGANFHGADSFTFKVNDGTTDSTAATVSMVISPVNDAPTATSKTVEVLEDNSLAITVTGADVDGDSLTYSLKEAPLHGTLSGEAPNFIYTPEPNFFGKDSFRFFVQDGEATAHGTITVNVIGVNDVPVAEPQSITLLEDRSAELTLRASDADGDPLGYVILNGPAHGTLSGVAPNLVYTPDANFHGMDSFTFRATEEHSSSEPVVVTITISPVNDAPTFTFSTGTIWAKKNAALETYVRWVQNITAGPNESEPVALTLSNSNPALFEVQPMINAEGTLTFNPRQGRIGTAVITVQAQDAGGTANGGVDQKVESFSIIVDTPNSIQTPTTSGKPAPTTAPKAKLR